jgi:hypothetical protein
MKAALKPLYRALFVAACALAAGCATDDQLRGAITEVNQTFRVEYESILAERGSRVYRVPRERAFAALRSSLSRVGMRLGDQAPDIGYLNVYADSPLPLAPQEWREAATQDRPKLRAIAMRYVGPLGYLIDFEPQGLETVINGATVGTAEGTEVSLTVRLRETAPPRSGIPRREYLPPTAVRMGLDKIWAELDRELPGLRVR